MSRTVFRNAQTFWYALYEATREEYDEYGNQVGASAGYGKPVEALGNISPARGFTAIQPFGEALDYDRVIAVKDRDTPIDEHAVLWIDSTPETDGEGALSVDADGRYTSPWNYIVRKVARGLPGFGSAAIAVKRVEVT